MGCEKSASIWAMASYLPPGTSESPEYRRYPAQLTRAVHDSNAVVILAAQFLGQLACAVRAVIVNDQNIKVDIGRANNSAASLGRFSASL
jgi:hypothetical protein